MAEKERGVFDLTSLKMTTRPLEGSKRPPTLQVGSWQNRPSFTVFTNAPGNLPRHGIINMNLDPVEFMMVLRDLEEIANEPFVEGQSRKGKISVHSKDKDQKHYGDIVYGRDDKGFMYISVVTTEEQFPKVVFRFFPARGIKYTDGSDNAAVKASRLNCLGRIDFWRATMPKHLMDNFIDVTKEGNGYKGGNKGSSGGGYSNSSGGGSVSDNDIPW